MRKLKAIRVRVYPTPEQEQSFLRIAGCCRLVYNLGLIQRRDFWRQHKNTTGRSIGWHGQKRELTALKALPEAAFLREAPSHCLQMALQDLDTAYSRFFEGHAGYPCPRRKGENDSFTFPDPAQIRIDVANEMLVLPKFGRKRGDGGVLKLRMHRKPYGELRRVSISRDGRHWYASILMRTKARVPQLPAPAPADVIGVDRGVTAPFVTSDGVSFGKQVEGAPQRCKQRRLARALSRTQRGSRRREKARLRLLAHKSKMARRRRDQTHKITAAIAKSHRIVVIEKLRVLAMTASARGTVETPGRNVAQKSGLNREILDRGWGEFRRQLGYKLAWRGGQLLEVPARNTSRTCAECDHVAAESRISRDLFRCVACGHEDDADRNAALEIRRRGLVALGLRQHPAGTVGAARGALCDSTAMKREKENDGINAKTLVDA